MVAGNTLCFDKQRVKDALLECAGNVDDATELLISRMNSSNVDLPDIEPLTSASGSRSHAPLTHSADHCRPLKAGGTNVTNEHESLVSIELQVHELEVTLKVVFGASAGGMHQQEPSAGSSPVSYAVESKLTSTTEQPKRKKLQASRAAVGGGRKPANNKPCPCHSGRRYKHCCKSKRTPASETKHPTLPTEHAVMQQLHTLDI